MQEGTACAPPPLLARIGKYEIVRTLGGGGMGEVYLARLCGPGGFAREVALKVIRPSLAADRRYVDMFLREGRLLAHLSHRSIVQIHELGSEDGRVYLAMEYLRGASLRELLAALGGRAPWTLAVHVCAEIAGALAAAHDLRREDAPRGLVHGDLSPSNVMVCVDGAVKVLDFGLARPSGADFSQSGIYGKLPYLAPEVLSRAVVDHRVDVYALGVMLYELVTGDLPFRGKSEMETMHLIRCAKPVPPSELTDDLPAGLDAVVARAMSRDRSTRYRSAADLAFELGALVRGRFGAAELAVDVASHLDASAPRSPFAGAPPTFRDQTRPGEPLTEPASRSEIAFDTSSADVLPRPGKDVRERASGRRRRPVALWAGGAAVLALVGAAAMVSRNGGARAEPVGTAASAMADVPAPSRTSVLLVTVDVPDARIVVDGEEVASAADSARVVVGENADHEIVASTADGRAQRRTVHVGAGTTVTVSFQLRGEAARVEAAPAETAQPRTVEAATVAPRKNTATSPLGKRQAPPRSQREAAPSKSAPLAPVNPFETW
jgi:eukaryotic-like serine/threonine-protein kinase